MGIDYGSGVTNVSNKLVWEDNGNRTRIRFGVISQHEVLQAWCDESEAWYGNPSCPHCGADVDPAELEYCDNHCGCGGVFDEESCYGYEPLSHYVDGEYRAECSHDDGDIFITDSPYYTRCGYCSPCAPGAGYLVDGGDDCYAFCFGPDWFDGKCPYPVWRVSDGALIYTPDNESEGCDETDE